MWRTSWFKITSLTSSTKSTFAFSTFSTANKLYHPWEKRNLEKYQEMSQQIRETERLTFILLPLVFLLLYRRLIIKSYDSWQRESVGVEFIGKVFQFRAELMTGVIIIFIYFNLDETIINFSSTLTIQSSQPIFINFLPSLLILFIGALSYFRRKWARLYRSVFQAPEKGTVFWIVPNKHNWERISVCLRSQVKWKKKSEAKWVSYGFFSAQCGCEVSDRVPFSFSISETESRRGISSHET